MRHYAFNRNNKMYAPFLSLVIERLSWVKIIAICKYGQYEIEDKARENSMLSYLHEKCLEKSISENEIKVIQCFFQVTIRLAKCVQEAIFLEWNTFSEKQLERVHSKLRQMVSLNLKKNEDPFFFARKKIDSINHQLLDFLLKKERLCSLYHFDEILLAECIMINKVFLKKTLFELNEAISRLLIIPSKD